MNFNQVKFGKYKEACNNTYVLENNIKWSNILAGTYYKLNNFKFNPVYYKWLEQQSQPVVEAAITEMQHSFLQECEESDEDAFKE